MSFLNKGDIFGREVLQNCRLKLQASNEVEKLEDANFILYFLEQDQKYCDLNGFL